VRIYQQLAAQLPTPSIDNFRSSLDTAAEILNRLKKPQSAQSLRGLLEAGELRQAAILLQKIVAYEFDHLRVI
jgi:hypothetical protein